MFPHVPVLVSVLFAFVSPSNAFIFPRATAGNATRARVTIPLTTAGGQGYSAAVHMGDPGNAQNFTFQLASTIAYTLVAGTNCTSCSTNTTAPLYNPALSQTYIAPPATLPPVTTTINGKTLSGVLGTENCSLVQENGTWWHYPQQRVIIAGQDSDSSGALPGSGVLGFGMTTATNVTDTFLGQYLNLNPTLPNVTIAVALNASGADSDSSAPAATSTPLPAGASDSSGGTLHIFQPDPSYYTGVLTTLPVAGQTTQQAFGATPNQLGSWDWTVQTQGWQFQNGGSAITGGQGTYATIEMAYPYILLTQGDAFKIFSTIPGSEEYNISNADVTSSGDPVYDDAEAISWSIPCSAAGNVAFTLSFGDTVVTLQSFTLFTQVNGVCVSNIKGWSDPTRTTYILGSSFMSNAYIVYTAYNDPQSNTIGVGNRLLTSQGKKSQTGAIVGGVIGGLAFLGLIAVLAFLYIRRQRRQRTVAPSSSYMSSHGMSPTATNGKGGFFGMGTMKRDENEDRLVPQPWTPESNADGTMAKHQDDGVVVMPWAPSAPGEQAFLSPEPGTGATTTFADVQQQGQPPQQHQFVPYSDQEPPQQSGERQRASSFTMTMVGTPPPGPGSSSGGHQTITSSPLPLTQQQGYSQLPTSPNHPVMWVERS